MSDEGANRVQRKIMKEIEEIQATPSISIEPKEHASIVRRELAKKFPKLKFSVRSNWFAGGTSVRVENATNITNKTAKMVSDFVDKFDGFKGDLMDGRYNVGFKYKGQRYVGASFCSFQHVYHTPQGRLV